jgi:hypothetical protein
MRFEQDTVPTEGPEAVPGPALHLSALPAELNHLVQGARIIFSSVLVLQTDK